MITSETIARLRCIEADCGSEYPINRRLYTCTSCGGLLDVIYDFKPSLSADEMKSVFRERKTVGTDLERSGVWRFRELLP